MSVRDLIDSGTLKVVRPRNLNQLRPAYMPLRNGVKYRTSWDDRKSHFVYPGTDHSFCGLGLCPPEDPDFGVNTGWDEVWWFVEDDREGSMCGTCSKGWSEWQQARRSTKSLPTESPITPTEWAQIGEQKVKPHNALAARKEQMLVGMINSILPVEEVVYGE